MKKSALAAMLFSALLGTHALADNGPTNPSPSSPPAGTSPTELPMPNNTDPRTQGNDQGRQGGASTRDTERSRPNAADGSGAENAAGKGGINGTPGSNTGGSGGSGSGQ